MVTCFPSKAPTQFRKFHRSWNRSATIVHSSAVLGICIGHRRGNIKGKKIVNEMDIIEAVSWGLGMVSKSNRTGN